MLPCRWEQGPGDDLEPTHGWLGWAESFLIIDYPNRSLLWDQSSLELDPPRLISHLFERSSRGFKAVWCPYGDDALWRYLSGDQGAAYGESQTPDSQLLLGEQHFAPITDPHDNDGAETLFTAVLETGEPACWLSDQLGEDVTESPITHLQAIAQRMLGLAFEGLPVWPLDEDGSELWPRAGVHLDFIRRRAWRWSNTSIRWNRSEPSLWPGWDFVEMGECFEVQEPFVNGRQIQGLTNRRLLEDEEDTFTDSRTPGEILAEVKVRESSAP